MSPVLSTPAPSPTARPRPASPSSAQLFPECPERHSPKTVAGELAPLPPGPSGEHLQAGLADCPPPASAAGRRPTGAAAGLSPGAKAPLVGIARLAASSPVAE